MDVVAAIMISYNRITDDYNRECARSPTTTYVVSRYCVNQNVFAISNGLDAKTHFNTIFTSVQL